MKYLSFTILLFLVSLFSLPAQQYNFKTFTQADGLPNNNIQFLQEDDNGFIWIATNKSVCRFDGVNFENFKLDNTSIEDLMTNKQQVFVNTELATFEFNRNQFEKLNRKLELNPSPILPVPNLLFESNCNLRLDKTTWYGTKRKGIWIEDEQRRFTKLTEKEGLPSNSINALLKDSWGNIWIGTDAGLVKYLGENFIHYNTSNGLVGRKVFDFAEDSFHNVWISNSNNALLFKVPEHLEQGNQFKRMFDFALPDVKINCLLNNQFNELWLGTHGKGIIIINPERNSLLRLAENLPSNWIRHLEEDQQSNIWLATTASGLAKIERDAANNFNIIPFTKLEGLPDLYISDIALDKQNVLYFCTNLGNLGRIQNDSIHAIFNHQNGLPELPLKSLAISNAKLYVGTEGGGIYVSELKDSLQFELLELGSGLNSNNINLLQLDHLGNLWAGTAAGLNKIYLQQEAPYLVEHFGRNEGFLGEGTLPNASFLDSDNNLWFGTKNGISKHAPTAAADEKLPPQLHFKDIALFYQPISATEYADWQLPSGALKSGLELPYAKNHISFDFKGVHQSYTQMQYQWKLEDVELDWSPLSKNTSVNYSNLKPGNYTFKVRAVANNNKTSETLTAEFTILKPYWQWLWLQILAGVILLSLIIGFAYWRIRSIQQREQKKRQQLELENQMLQLEAKAMQLQMNPHFIFNALNSIQALVATQQPNEARKQIQDFAQLMRSILSNSKRELLTLEDEIKTLDKYLTIEQFCQPLPFDFEISANNIQQEEIEIPPMLIQPYVENSVIHGLAHLTDRKGNIKIDFQISGELLHCTIEDNGVGRAQSKVLNQSKKPGHQSVAMEVTQERLLALKQGQKYKPVKIDDVLNDEKEVVGTRVTLILPYQQNF